MVTNVSGIIWDNLDVDASVGPASAPTQDDHVWNCVKQTDSYSVCVAAFILRLNWSVYVLDISFSHFDQPLSKRFRLSQLLFVL